MTERPVLHYIITLLLHTPLTPEKVSASLAAEHSTMFSIVCLPATTLRAFQMSGPQGKGKTMGRVTLSSEVTTKTTTKQ